MYAELRLVRLGFKTTPCSLSVLMTRLLGIAEPDMSDIEFVKSEIERMRGEVSRQRKEILQLQRAGIACA
jgi:hypothetical protein